MARPLYQVADVLERNEELLTRYTGNSWQLRTLHALRKCRTAALGGHIDRCNDPRCDRLHLSYNSCRNRHCPKCQGHKREQWIRAREKELLNVPYFHVVFTLPDTLNQLCLYAPKQVYTILFKTAWSVLRDFGADPKFLGAGTGMVAILHTWGQNLSLHPHLHCIVPGGGLTANGKWKYAKNKGKYLFPVKAMSKVFRARFVENIGKEFDQPRSFYDRLFAKDWVVYAKRPFANPEYVVEYLGRYTHKIAIGNHRIRSIANGKVIFTAKDYKKGGAKQLLGLSDAEFIRRFSLHVLPKGFVRIRHYGILSSTKKKTVLPLLMAEMGQPPPKQESPPILHRRCPSCNEGILVTVFMFDGRGPPGHWIAKIKEQDRNPRAGTA
ncbi:IS91 family transposase [Zobellia sp. OII3]|uniref:IS91 family transposase n=1 Tax=Zobellia sp. OII3 TaxID=2034520 RepID=UPI000B533CFF|nr:IS91 family transposase [Zobellia sp. OII3]OWW23494.1 IS91 family transposase [Zobellia sp. OII3]